MAKSRVEKNKKLYDKIELESFDIKKEDTLVPNETLEVVDIKESTPLEETTIIEKEENNEIVDVKPSNEEYVVDNPISYTSKLSVEEILRAKLEKQRKLKQTNKTYKKSPITDNYSAKMMQKNIKQHEGIDIRKEMHLGVKKSKNYRGLIIGVLIVILILVLIYFIVF